MKQWAKVNCWGKTKGTQQICNWWHFHSHVKPILEWGSSWKKGPTFYFLMFPHGLVFNRVITSIKWPVKSDARVIDPYLGGPIILKKTHAEHVNYYSCRHNQPTNKQTQILHPLFCNKLCWVDRKVRKQSHVTFYFHLSMKCGAHCTPIMSVCLEGWAYQIIRSKISKKSYTVQPLQGETKNRAAGALLTSTYFDRWNNPSYRHLWGHL